MLTYQVTIDGDTMVLTCDITGAISSYHRVSSTPITTADFYGIWEAVSVENVPSLHPRKAFIDSNL